MKKTKEKLYKLFWVDNKTSNQKIFLEGASYEACVKKRDELAQDTKAYGSHDGCFAIARDRWAEDHPEEKSEKKVDTPTKAE